MSLYLLFSLTVSDHHTDGECLKVLGFVDT